MRFIKVILSIVLIIFFSLFVTQNYSTINLQFLNYTFALPAFLLILISVLVGFLIPTSYFSVKLISKTKKLGQIGTLLEYLYRGYYSAASHASESLAKSWEPAGVIYAESNFATKNYTFDSIKLEKSKGLVEGYIGSQLLRVGDLQSARSALESALSKDRNNLITLKAYRDLCYMESKIDECVKYQERILQNCERWEKENQKAVLAELLCVLAQLKSDSNERAQLLKRAYDTFKTSFVYSSYIDFLLESDGFKDAKKVIERVLKENMQDEVFLILSDKEITLTKLLDILEQHKDFISPSILARVYMRLNMVSKLQQIEQSLEDPMRIIVQMHISHAKEAKACKEVLLELYKPWECVCGVSYNSYMPFCTKCHRWGEVSLRKL